MPLEFSISPSTKGSVYATKFTFTKTTLPTHNTIAWSFGDGNVEYNKNEVTHSYNFPGVYNVSLSAWSSQGSLETASEFVEVDYIYRDAILIANIPSKWGIPGLPSIEPFTVSLTSAKINEPLSIVLQALNTKSVPHYAVPDKWHFLVPKWKFVNANTNEIIEESVPLITGPLYKDSTIVAVTGEASFYYIDDLATGTDPTVSCPLLITATLSTENFTYPPETLIYPYYSYSNSEVARAVIAWQINDVIPTNLKISENFLNDIYTTKWDNIPIPVMATCRFDPSLVESFSSITEISATDVLSYPRTNELGSFSAVDFKLSGVDPSLYIVNDTPLYFKATDEQNNVSSGYIFTTITPLTTISSTTVVASTIAFNQQDIENVFPFPDGFPISPEVYISHPFESNINKVNIVTYPEHCTDIAYFKNLGVLTDGMISFINVPALSTSSVENLQLSGTTGIYGISYNPVKEIIYAADADQNKIYAINNKGVIINTLELSADTGDIINSPSYISIDQYHNVWVSLFDRYVLLKYDYTLETLLASAVPFTDINILTAYEEGSNLIEPPIVETDKDNNIWACYSHPTSSLLIKFDDQGIPLVNCSDLILSSVPVSLAINKRNDVWVACKQTDEVRCYDTNGILLSSFEFLKPSYIALDRQNNLWILHGYNFCSILNTATNGVSSWRIQTTAEFPCELVYNKFTSLSSYSSEDIEMISYNDEIWGGLTIDVYNRAWFVDSENNRAGVFSVFTPTNIRLFDVLPTASTNFIIRTGDEFVTEINTNIVRSAQVAGDWSGNRWFQKYAGFYNTLAVSGVSTPFTVYDLHNDFKIAKTNESFDYASYMRSLALPENLYNNHLFFTSFLPCLVGNGDNEKEELGRIAYEKTANFTGNHSDVDTAETEQLVALAKQLSVETKTFGTDFPAEIKRLINLFSVPKTNLRGVPNLEADINNNIGPILTASTLISATQYLFAKDKRFDAFQLIYVSPVDGLGNVYSLSSIEIEGYRTPVTDNYYFFEYNNENSIGYKFNLIDWNSPHTTITYNLSTNDEWYGEDQIIEKYFNNLLTKRLFEQ